MEIRNGTFIIAEMSGNHGGSLDKAKAMIVAAKTVGCDAIKIQTYEPADLNDPDNNAIYEKCKIPRTWHAELFAEARTVGITLFSSVFSVDAIRFLEGFDCPYYKIASPESTRLSQTTYKSLADAIRSTGKRFMASSGKQDIDFMQSLYPDVLFYCKAGYPATIGEQDLAFLSEMQTWPSVHLGFSDHTADLISPLAMIGAGARYIEKHFKIDEDCIDAAFSFNPKQMELLCRIAHR